MGLRQQVIRFHGFHRWEKRSSRTEHIRPWGETGGNGCSSNELPERRKMLLCAKRDLFLRYNRNPVIIPDRTIRVLVCEQSLRKYLGAVSGFLRQQIVAVCYASGISKMFMQVVYKFNNTVFQRR